MLASRVCGQVEQTYALVCSEAWSVCFDLTVFVSVFEKDFEQVFALFAQACLEQLFEKKLAEHSFEAVFEIVAEKKPFGPVLHYCYSDWQELLSVLRMPHWRNASDSALVASADCRSSCSSCQYLNE
ncbi:MAG: hypothetical protein MJ084_06685 [Saccharofermentans sp.]|nr:hypothetical protein [Saccharofermentans sp.]